MSDSEKWDRLLRQALASVEEPERELNESLMKRMEERSRMKRVVKKRISAGVLVAVFALAMSITAFATKQLFSSKEVAEQIGQHVLAEAFESSDAIEINDTAASGGYSFTLHGIVSGAGLTELGDGAEQQIHPDRTYAVLSIVRQDGTPMPHTSDPEYGEEPFFVSPYVKGLKPWQVNIATMSGGYNEIVVDGVMYRLIECDGIEMFADRGVYLGISGGSSFYNSEAIAYDESTGEISVKTGFNGVSLLFDLPLDSTKADPAKAEAYLKQLLRKASKDKAADEAGPVDPAEAELANYIAELTKKVPDGTLIPESVQEVTYDEEGRINYEYDGWSVKLSVEMLFSEGQVGYSDAVQFSEDDTSSKALLFSRNGSGVITGKIIVLN